MNGTMRDVVVVGAGPAGCVAATCLAQAGADVLLLERAVLPREKVCGCCLAASGLAVLKEMDVVPAILRAGARELTSVRLRCRDRSAVMDIAPGLAISRGSLDSVLAQRAQRAGVELQDGASAEVTPGDGCECVRVRHLGAEVVVRSRVVIVADGLGGSSLRRYPGLAWKTARASRIGLGAVVHTGVVPIAAGAVHMHVGQDGYVGMVRLEDDLVDVAAAVDPRALRTHVPGAVVAEVLRSCGLQADWASSVRWHGTPSLTRQRERVAQKGVFVVGDAAGYVEPFTGEGMSWAVRAGAAVTKHCLAWMAGDADAPARWEREYQRLVRSNQRACRALSWLVRKPRVAACGIGLVGVVPDASELVRWALSPRNATEEAAPWTR